MGAVRSLYTKTRPERFGSFNYEWKQVRVAGGGEQETITSMSSTLTQSTSKMAAFSQSLTGTASTSILGVSVEVSATSEWTTQVTETIDTAVTTGTSTSCTTPSCSGRLYQWQLTAPATWEAPSTCARASGRACTHRCQQTGNPSARCRHAARTSRTNTTRIHCTRTASAATPPGGVRVVPSPRGRQSALTATPLANSWVTAAAAALAHRTRLGASMLGRSAAR